MQYLELVEQFKEAHKEVESFRQSGFSTTDIKHDIAHMEDEKIQLAKRIDRLKQKVLTINTCHQQHAVNNTCQQHTSYKRSYGTLLDCVTNHTSLIGGDGHTDFRVSTRKGLGRALKQPVHCDWSASVRPTSQTSVWTNAIMYVIPVSLI